MSECMNDANGDSGNIIYCLVSFNAFRQTQNFLAEQSSSLSLSLSLSLIEIGLIVECTSLYDSVAPGANDVLEECLLSKCQILLKQVTH